MEFYVMEVRTKKREEGVLILVETENDFTCETALKSVRDKLPLLNKENAFIKEKFNLTITDEFNAMKTIYFDKTIHFKINISSIGTQYITETHIHVNDLDFHDRPLSAIHINRRRDIMENPNFEKEYNIVNNKIKSLLACSNTNFSLFEINMIWKIDDETVKMWDTILKNNDLSFIFHKIDIDTIINISNILYEMVCRYNRHLYFFFVDSSNNLYRIEMDSTMEIIPVESNRYII